MDISTATSLNRVLTTESEKQASQSADEAVQSGANLPVDGKEKPAEPQPSEVKKAVLQIQEYIAKSGRQLKFHVDEQSGRTVITVINTRTQEVIRQIPGEEVLNIAAALEQSGLQLFDDTA